MCTDAYGMRISMRRRQHPQECVLVLSRDLCTVCLARIFLGIIQRLAVPIESTVQMSSCDAVKRIILICRRLSRILLDEEVQRSYSTTEEHYEMQHEPSAVAKRCR